MSTETAPQATPASALRTQIERVHGARQNVAAMDGALKAKREAFERDNADLISLLSAQKQSLSEEELRLRDMAVAEFKATGATKPGPGLSIRQKTVIAYDDMKAFAWAQEKGVAVALDRKSFEAIAKATPLPFVTVETHPEATLATDLGKALEGGA